MSIKYKAAMLYAAMEFSVFELAVLIGTVGLQAITAVTMMIRKLHTRLPIFFAYMVFHIAGSAVMWAASEISYADYFYIYWSLEILDAFLSLLVIQEIFSVVLAEYESLKSLGEMLFRWGTLLIVIVTVFTASAAPGADSDRLVAGLVVLQRSVGLVETGLLLLLFLFCHWFGLSWRDHVFGIALGFGMMSSLVLAAGSIRTHFGLQAGKLYEYVNPASYTLAVIIWAVYVLVPERSHVTDRLEGAEQLREWNRALLYLTRR